MKKITIITTIILLSSFTAAQVTIGKTDPSNESVLLEFDNEAKGIIVPQVASAPGAVGGTFIFDSVSKTLKVWEGKNNNNTGGWTDLTADITTTPTTVGIAHTYTNNGTDVTGINGVIIGSDTSTKPGALVLESTEKALVLPSVANPHLNITGAVAGTMVYDTAADMIAVYDGVHWSYWK